MHRDPDPQKDFSSYLPFLVPNCCSGDNGIPSPAGHLHFPSASGFGLDPLNVSQKACADVPETPHWTSASVLETIAPPPTLSFLSARAGWVRWPSAETHHGSRHPLQIHLHPEDEVFNPRMWWELPPAWVGCQVCCTAVAWEVVDRQSFSKAFASGVLQIKLERGIRGAVCLHS